VTHKSSRTRRTTYRVAVDESGIRVEFDEYFWNDTVIDDKGTTALDFNIAQVLQEIQTALYYIGTTGTKH